MSLFDCTLYLIRHGESEGNVLKTVQGQSQDSLLTDNGRWQSRAVGRRLATEVPIIHRLISSPLRRALETAAIIGGELKHQGKIEVEPALTERSWGVYEGLSIQEMLKRQWGDEGHGLPEFAPPGGETAKQVEDRVIGWVNDQLIQPLMQDHTEQLRMHYVIVTHSEVIRRLMRVLGKMDAEKVMCQRIHNVSISTFRITSAGVVPLLINATEHLPEDERA